MKPVTDAFLLNVAEVSATLIGPGAVGFDTATMNRPADCP
jgi:hypothetical protein